MRLILPFRVSAGPLLWFPLRLVVPGIPMPPPGKPIPPTHARVGAPELGEQGMPEETINASASASRNTIREGDGPKGLRVSSCGPASDPICGNESIICEQPSL